MSMIVVSGLAYLGWYWYSMRKNQTPATTQPQTTTNQASVNALFTSNFDDSKDLDKWEIFDETDAKEGPSHWFFEDGVLKQDANIWAGSFGKPVINKSYLGSSIVTKEGDNWRNYYAKFKFKPLDNDGIGFLVRFRDRNNYLRIFTIQDATQDNGGPMIKVDKRIRGKTYGIYTKKFTYKTGEWNEGNIKVKDNKIVFWLGTDKKNSLIWGIDNYFKKGRFGFSVYAEEGVEIDEVVITKL
jgi:hypothetical protein